VDNLRFLGFALLFAAIPAGTFVWESALRLLPAEKAASVRDDFTEQRRNSTIALAVPSILLAAWAGALLPYLFVVLLLFHLCRVWSMSRSKLAKAAVGRSFILRHVVAEAVTALGSIAHVVLARA